MAGLHKLFKEFIDAATCKPKDTAPSCDQIDEIGTALWELLVHPEHRQALAHEQPLSEIISEMTGVVQMFANTVCTLPQSQNQCWGSIIVLTRTYVYVP